MKTVTSHFNRIILLPSIALFFFLNPANVLSQELLGDPGFELSSSEGTFPDSGYWSSAWFPYEAGAICTSTAAHTGRSGLWTYSASTAASSWTGTYQEVSASPGQIATASAYIRTPAPGPWVSWVEGSKAFVRVEFFNASYPNQVLASVDSPGVSSANSGWGFYSVTTDPAPQGTTKVRYRAYLYKPPQAGVAGQSVANFDDCSLTLSTPAEEPALQVSPVALGLRKDQLSGTFTIKNSGTGTLEWSLTSSASWISEISPTSGSLGQEEQETVTVTVSRSGLSAKSYETSIPISSNAGSDIVTVYMDMPGFVVPSQASLSRTDGAKLLLQKRLQSGALGLAEPYIIKGVAWSPVGIGSAGDITSRRDEFRNWYVADIQLMKKAGINTVYTFIDMWWDARGLEVLDNLYKNGIMAIVTVDEDGNNNTEIIDLVVPAYKNHPAILMWALGNEWNILRPDVSKYYKKYNTRYEAALAMQAAALQIKALDNAHAVASIMGEIKMDDQPLSQTADIVNNLCSAVDVWGANIYRGDNFGVGSDNLFNQWASITTKPLFLSEYGTDSYRTTQHWSPTLGYVDEPMQSAWNHGLWSLIEANLSATDPSKVCLGGTVFEWIDEWWKTRAENGGSTFVHDNNGFETYWNWYAHPDGFANEEYFGIVDIDRRARASYHQYKTDYSPNYSLALYGTIYQKPANQLLPLESATVSVLALDKITVLASTLTNANGSFWIVSSDIPIGTYYIRTSKDAYQTHSGATELRKTNAVPFSVTLSAPQLVELPLSVTINSGESYQLTLAARDSNNDQLSFSAAGLPAGATLWDNTNNTAQFSWTPTAAQAGEHLAVFEVSDGLFSKKQEMPITVLQGNSPPLLSVPSELSINEGKALSFTVSARDPDSEDKVELTCKNIPRGATFSADTGLFSWKPDFRSSGTYDLVFWARDDHGATASSLLRLTVINSSLYGEIIDKRSGAAISQARVRVSRARPHLVYEVLSDASGAYVLEKNLPSGKYKVQVKKQRFLPLIKDLNIRAEQSAKKQFFLQAVTSAKSKGKKK